ncbi:MAG: energy transducer TonB [Acidobacteria bacterium]|nr:energy transducer TonB [Acidobacteriota bacterium]
MCKRLSSATVLLLLLSIAAIAQEQARELLISVPSINGLATYLVKPAFPETALDVGGDDASIGLRVVVDEGGNVVSAQCSTTCHPMLKAAAELAAMNSKFKRQTYHGRPVKDRGTLLCTYVVKHVNWHRFGTAIESTRQFDNISLGPVAQILSADYAGEKSKLLSLDAEPVSYDARQKVIAEVINSIKFAKLIRWKLS